jgi:hypothetical protein
MGPAACGSSSPTVTTLGCDQYCQQAGVPQGVEPPPSHRVAILTAGRVRVLSNGVVPIKVVCRAERTCIGAIVLGLTDTTLPGLKGDIQAGHSDLLVDANRTRTLGVPLLAPVRRLLRRRRQVPMLVYLETGRYQAVADRTSIVVTAGG